MLNVRSTVGRIDPEATRALVEIARGHIKLRMCTSLTFIAPLMGFCAQGYGAEPAAPYIYALGVPGLLCSFLITYQLAVAMGMPRNEASRALAWSVVFPPYGLWRLYVIDKQAARILRKAGLFFRTYSLLSAASLQELEQGVCADCRHVTWGDSPRVCSLCGRQML